MTFPAAAVFGYPAKHSRSPLVHGHWLRERALRGAYLRWEIPPERFAEAARSLARHGLVGANVTVPHKEAAFAAVEEPDPAAVALGAVNTLWLDGGRLHGANTDGAGFLGNLDERAPGWDRERRQAVVLGAGGSSRAIVHALLARGFGRVVVANRTLGRAEALRAAFGAAVLPVALADAARFVADADVLANTTTLGMRSEAPPVDLAGAPDAMVVTDAVYVPLETPLLAAARARKLRAVDGLGMLLHQAVPGFERFFGVRAAVTPALRALVEADLAPAR